MAPPTASRVRSASVVQKVGESYADSVGNEYQYAKLIKVQTELRIAGFIKLAVQLTEEQQAIVQHDYGPARVFAVAGAGKTTAMVHRIQRLVQSDRFEPSRILATSFSRAAVQEIEVALRRMSNCGTVKTWTLHKLGYFIIRRARAEGYLPGYDLSNLDPEQVNRTVLFQAIGEARKLGLDFKDELEDLDQEDFLAYVSRCKGNLQYADWHHGNFPTNGPHARVAQPAEPPFEPELAWYLDLYRLFEEIRVQSGLISFDDMLMMGWELLASYPDLLAEVQNLFDCVIVDEFQDVNRAQFGLLDLITQPHRNYMVIGDDDQTIYEWRGANARFIAETFEKRYQPTTYTITDNFRCQASQIVLANQVIRHNQQRYPKALSLTQGFNGSTQIHHSDSLEQMGQRIAAQVRSALEAGFQPTEIAILVRVYAQTPYIEQFLIKEQIPYWGPDLVPFYQRSEILNFLALGRLARAQWLIQSGAASWNALRADLDAAWNRVKLIPPIRYLNKELKQSIQTAIFNQQAAVSESLWRAKLSVPSSELGKKLDRLAQWIITMPTEAAETALQDLDRCLNYREYLKHHSGFVETGQGKAAGVEALIDYAREKGTLMEFLEYLDQMKQAQTQQHRQDTRQCVRLTTIHQAKGLEWPVVIIPNCNQGIIPFGEPQLPSELEEERRLLYVAITRSKRNLHLHLLDGKEVSQFLREANYQDTLQQIDRLQSLLTRSPHHWDAPGILHFLQNLQKFRLERYFHQWWDVEPSVKAATATAIQQLFQAIESPQSLKSLGLEPKQLEFWQQLHPVSEPSPMEIVGLDQVLKPLRTRPFASVSRLPRHTCSLFRAIQPGDRVTHAQFGQGQVANVVNEELNDVITVIFHQHGEKRILVSPSFCALQRLR